MQCVETCVSCECHVTRDVMCCLNTHEHNNMSIREGGRSTVREEKREGSRATSVSTAAAAHLALA